MRDAGETPGAGRDWGQNGAIGRAARAAIEKTVRAGAAAYQRSRDLPGLIRVSPEAGTVEELRVIVAKLERALRAERARARSGHWTYDLNRHIALHQAHRAESAMLAALTAGRQD